MKLYNPRLRVLDINTPWFWFTIFYRPRIYGDSWLVIEFWQPHAWRKWWFHFWQWEETPNCKSMEGETLTEEEQKL